MFRCPLRGDVYLCCRTRYPGSRFSLLAAHSRGASVAPQWLDAAFVAITVAGRREIRTPFPHVRSGLDHVVVSENLSAGLELVKRERVTIAAPLTSTKGFR